MENFIPCYGLKKYGWATTARLFLTALFFTTAVCTVSAQNGTNSPSCNIVGPLTSCANHNPNDRSGDIMIVIQVAFATSHNTISYSFASNSAGAFIRQDLHGTILSPQDTSTQHRVAIAQGVFRSGPNTVSDTLIVFPGTQGSEFNLRVDDSTLNLTHNFCECSKSVSVTDVFATTQFPTIACFGETTTLSVYGQNAGPNGDDIVNYFDSLYSAGQHYPFGAPGNPNPNNGVATYPGLSAGTYNLTVYSEVDGCEYDTTIVIGQPHYNPTSLTCPQSTSVPSCQSQTDVHLEFGNWLAGVQSSGGTNPHLTDDHTVAPSRCGGSVTVTWNLTDDCNAPQSCFATFSVDQPAPVSLTPPQDMNLPACMSQQDINNAFDIWVNSATHGGGCDVQFGNDNTGAPLACGGSTTVTWTLTSSCEGPKTASATFSVTPAPGVGVTPPVERVIPPCSSQIDIDAAFNSWLASAFYTGGCNVQFTNDNTGAPLACGGSTTVTFTATSSCSAPVTGSATFSVTPADRVILNVPDDLHIGSCHDVNDVGGQFFTWLNSANSSGGCNTQVTNDWNPIGGSGVPNACGGTITVTWTATSLCQDPIMLTRNFVVDPAPVVTLNVPENQNLPACMSQQDVNNSFDTWLNSATHDGGCNAQFGNDNTGAPLACGGSTTVTWTVTSSCEGPKSGSATFSVTPATGVTVTPPQNLNLPACTSQLDIDAAWNSWLASATYNGGCNVQFVNDNTGSPLACGGTTTVTFTALSSCSLPVSNSATFSIDPALPVVLNIPQSVTAGVCRSQTDITAQFNAWLISANTLGGCNTRLTNDWSNDNAVVSACGGSVTVTWTAFSDCQLPVVLSASFTVPNAPETHLTCPQDMTLPACHDQSEVDAAYAQWLGSANGVGGCDGHLSNNSEGVPAACGGSTTVTFTYTTSCSNPQTCSATFTVNFPSDPSLTCPQNTSTNACEPQTLIDLQFQAWLGSVVATGGCHGQLTDNNTGAPGACGGSTDVTFTYTATGYQRTGNLIVNGDFSAGNNGFNSDYHFVSPQDNTNAGGQGLYPEGTYAVDADAHVYHPAFFGHDHTGGNGPFFMINNGSVNAGTEVWQQGIGGILPNTNYEFSCWVTSVNPDALAQLNFSINGQIIGNQFQAPAVVGDWIKFQTTWNSGANTTADISIVDQNTIPGGNDFGLDDISFAPSEATCAPVTKTCTATFTVPSTTPGTLFAPESTNIPACESQPDVDQQFFAWLNSATFQGGCNAHISTDYSNDNGTVPACGGSMNVTFTLHSDCQQDQSVTRTFSVTPAPVVSLNAPADHTENSCQSQLDITNAFNAWLGSVTHDGGCNPQITNDNTGAPAACGGTTIVTWTLTSTCDAPHTASAAFNVTPATPVTLTAPEGQTIPACESQLDVTNAFNAWLALVNYGGGCNAHISNNNTGAPLACGGSTTVTWTVTSACEPDKTASATFSVTPATPVVFNTPQSTTVGACQSQGDVDAAFRIWMGGASISGGCNASVNSDWDGETTPLACGGSVTINWTGTSDCEAPHFASATFTVTPATPVVLNVPQNTTLPACISPADESLAFNAWLNSANASGGCNRHLSNDYSNDNGLPSACGGSVTVTWTASSACQPDVINSATFSIDHASDVNLTVPQDMTLPVCSQQSIVDNAFAIWLQGATHFGGCNAQVNNDYAGQQVSACGGNLTVNWTLTSSCQNPITQSATFSVTPATPVTLNVPDNVHLTACQEPGSAEAQFFGWLGSGSSLGGCNTFVTNDWTPNSGVPGSCGGNVTVTWTAHSDCQPPVSLTRTFVVDPAPPVVLNGPENQTVGACQSQLDVDGEFQLWLAGANHSGGCGVNFSNDNTGAPLACGGSTTVTWNVTSSCEAPKTVSATFSVTPATPVVLTVPESTTIAACTLQADVNAAFDTWLHSATINGGCNTTLNNDYSNDNGTLAACGGSVTVTWTASSTCEPNVSNSATFSVTPASPVNLVCAQDITVPSCQEQADIDAAFAIWLGTAGGTGGCNGHLTNNNEGVPAACGGSTAVTFTYTSDCAAPQTCTATFTVNFPSDITLTCPQSTTVNGCQAQTDVDAEFQTWLHGVVATGGCHGQLTDNNTGAPNACGGSTDVTFTYTATGYQRTGNLIVNGDFSAGNTGFNSDYHYVSPQDNANAGGNGLVPEGDYAVDADAHTYHPAFFGHDHTGGNGPFFMINNGSVNSGTEVWQQGINGILPNTNYEFSCWVTSVNPGSPAELNFSINGQVIGNLFQAPPVDGEWIKFQTTWNSGSNTTADISIVDQNTIPGGNDFGLDDISFAPSEATCAPVTKTCTATFTVPQPSSVTLNAPESTTIPACQSQTDVDAQFYAWLNSATYGGGCAATIFNNFNNDNGTVSACGGSIDVTFTVRSNCQADQSVTRTFTVSPAPTVSLTAPESMTVGTCETPAQVEQEFNTWLGGVNYGGGCNAHISNDNTGAPLACGGSTTVTWTVTSTCQTPVTASATFTVPGAGPVTLTGPENQTIPACQSQTDVTNAFIAWLAQVNYGGGCNAHISDDNTGAPSACGGSTTVTWTVTSSCEAPKMVSAMFSVTPTTPVVLNVPNSTSIASCQSQQAVNDAFNAWLNSANANGGCNRQLTNDYNNDNGNGLTPCGGSITVTWTATSNCEAPHTASASFSVNPATPVVLTGPGDLTVNMCQTQAAVDNEFTAWLNGAHTIGGCNTSLTNDYSNDNGTPSRCGGTFTVTWMASSDCEAPHTVSATFTVPADHQAPVITVTASTAVPNNPNANQIAAAFGTASATDNCTQNLTPVGTIGAETNTSGCTYSVTKTWTVSDYCGNPATASQTVTFTRDVTPPTIHCSADKTLACNSPVTFDPPTATDNCDQHPVITILVSDNTVGNVHTRTWKATDASGLSATCSQSVTVNHSSLAMGNCSHTNPTCAGGVGTVSAGTVTGAAGTPVYTWKNSAGTTVGTTATVGNLPAGTYTLTVSDACGSVTCTQTITAPPAMTMTACSHTNPSCNSGCHSGTPGSVSAGTVSGATGTVHYTWKNAAGQTIGTGTTVSGLGAGTYYLTVTDNCTTLTCQQTITEPSQMVMGNCSHTDLTCNSSCGSNYANSGSVTAGTITGANGAVHYTWKNSNGQTVGTNATVTGLPVGTYTLTVTDNCSSLTCTQTITAPPAMAMGSCSHVNPGCGSSTGSVTAGIITNNQGTIHYTWRNSNGQTVGTTATVSNLPAGTYTLTVSDNCSSLTCSQTITGSSTMTMGACSHTNLTCNTSCGSNYGTSGSVTAGSVSGANGTVHYVWKNANGQTVGSAATVTGLGAGTYTLTVTDNCTTLTCSQTITQPTALSMGACSHTNLTCNTSCGSNYSTSGSVTAGTVSGGNGTMHYVWKNSNGQTVGSTATVTGLGAGTYNLTVSDNCSSVTCSQTITQPAAMTMASCTHTNATCSSSTGSVSAGNISNANGTVHYVWKKASNGQTVGSSATVSGLAPGTYNLTVTDNCSTLTCSQTISASTGNISCSISSHPASGCAYTGGDNEVIYLGYGPQSTTLTASVSGTGPFTYSWSPANHLSSGTSSAPVFTPTSSGMYNFTLTVTNGSGCSSTCNISICVLDIRVPSNQCGSGGYGHYVYLCHGSGNGCGGSNYSTISVNTNDVAYYLNHYGNDHLGTCSQSCGSAKFDPEEDEITQNFDVSAFPNPFMIQLHMLIKSSATEPINVKVFDELGQLIGYRENIPAGSDFTIGDEYAAGVYIVEVRQGENVKTMRVVKAKPY